MARRSEGWTCKPDKRTGIHTVRFRVAGERKHFSTGKTDPAEAQVEAARIYAESVSGRQRTSGVSRDPLDLVLALWIADAGAERDPSTVEAYERYASTHWIPFFRTLSRMTDAGLEDYMRHRLRLVQAVTVRKELSGLRQFLTWATTDGRRYFDVMPRVPTVRRNVTGTVHDGGKRKKVRVELTREQVEKLLRALPDRTHRFNHPARAYFTVMWETSLRKGTLNRLSVPQHYRRGARELRIEKKIDKSRYARDVPLTARARKALDSVCPDRGLIFGAVDYRETLRRAALGIGLPEDLASHVSYHDFRHARITHLAETTGKIVGIAQLAGHKNVTTTDKYMHASKRAALEVIDAIRDTDWDTNSDDDDRPKRPKRRKRE